MKTYFTISRFRVSRFAFLRRETWKTKREFTSAFCETRTRKPFSRFRGLNFKLVVLRSCGIFLILDWEKTASKKLLFVLVPLMLYIQLKNLTYKVFNEYSHWRKIFISDIFSNITAYTERTYGFFGKNKVSNFSI